MENNLAPNTQVGRIIIEDPNDPNKSFGKNEHPDMFSNDDEEAKYSRGGEFLDNMMTDNVLEFCWRWMGLGNVFEVIEDIKEFYKFNGYNGKAIDAQPGDAIWFSKDKSIEALKFREGYSLESALILNDELDKETKDKLKEEIKKGAIL